MTNLRLPVIRHQFSNVTVPNTQISLSIENQDGRIWIHCSDPKICVLISVISLFNSLCQFKDMRVHTISLGEIYFLLNLYEFAAKGWELVSIVCFGGVP